MTDTRKKLSSFIDAERKRFDNRHNNMFATSLSQVNRYREFLEIIFNRYLSCSDKFMQNSEELKKRVKLNNSWSFQNHEESINIVNNLHLEVESFYQFAKILLDKMARFIEFYFGKVRGKSLDSHDDLHKNIAQLSLSKRIVVSEKLKAQIKYLKEKISDYRDYNIAHEKSPRTLLGTSYTTKGETKISSGRLSPKENDNYFESESLDKLLPQIDTYIELIIEFIRENEDKTNLQIQKQKTNQVLT